MTPLSIIVAVSKNNVIGKGGTIPWHIPEDFKFFRETTMGQPILMGRNTWLSLPNGPLPGRLNIVISQTKVDNPMVMTFPSLEAAHAFLTENGVESAFVIGGERLYNEAMAIATELYISRVDLEIEDGDTFFDHPIIQDERTWHRAQRIETVSKSTTHPGVEVAFERWVRRGL
jgi:dihydrofolate reductase